MSTIIIQYYSANILSNITNEDDLRNAAEKIALVHQQKQIASQHAPELSKFYHS